MDGRDLTGFRKTEQFVQFYYQTFDNNRPQLAGLYVRYTLFFFFQLPCGILDEWLAHR